MTLTKTLTTDRLTPWHAIAAVGMAALGVAATMEAWRDMFLIAKDDEEYSHIFIVPVVALWMVWVRRMRFRHCRTTGTFLGPLVVGFGWLRDPRRGERHRAQLDHEQRRKRHDCWRQGQHRQRQWLDHRWRPVQYRRL